MGSKRAGRKLSRAHRGFPIFAPIFALVFRPIVAPVFAFLLSGAILLRAQSAALSPEQAQAMVDRALANELRAAQDMAHPMRYRLRKTTPRLTTTREIFETKDGDVARLLSVNGAPLGADAERGELARLDELAHDPGRQRHRKQAEDADTERALKVLRALPSAFLYEYAGQYTSPDASPGEGPTGVVEKFTFRPNPSFSPPDLETQVLAAMTGEIWIDPAHDRVTHLEGHLQHDVDFGWGILGRLYKGGSISIDQAEVFPELWRTVRMQMSMSGRVVFRTRNFDMTQEQSRFGLLPTDMGYEQAIAKLKSGE